MDSNQILNQVKINRLEGEEYGFIISQLCVLNNKHHLNNTLNGVIYREKRFKISMFHVEQFDFRHRFHVKRKTLEPY